jgi:hypothetical protein
MARPIGIEKSGGRGKGTPNRKTVTLHDALSDLDVPKRLIELIPTLEPAKQADVLVQLMSYLYPKRKAIEHSGANGDPITFDVRSFDLAAMVKENPEAMAALSTIEKLARGRVEPK